MDLTCPKCHSDQTQKVSAIVSAGTTYSSGDTTVVGLANTGNGLTAGSAVGIVNMTNTSDLAQRLAPPEMKDVEYIPKFIKWALFLIIPGVPAGALVVEILGAMHMLDVLSTSIVYLLMFIPYIAACIYLFKRLKIKAAENELYNLTEGAKHLGAWRSSYYCHRCGQTFIPQSN